MKTKIDKKVMMMAAAAAAAVSLVLGILGIVSIYVPSLVCVAGPIGCIVSYAVPVVAGGYAVKKHGITKDKIVEGLLVGAITGVVTGVAAGVVGLITSLISFPLYSSYVNTSLGQIDTSGYVASAALAGGATIVGSIIGLFITVFFYVVLASVSGLIVAAITENKAK